MEHTFRNIIKILSSIINIIKILVLENYSQETEAIKKWKDLEVLDNV